jgi:pimeloyl-ACP methyl ester carboxylesterase
VTAFLLLPGAGGMSWYWHAVAERLDAAGHVPIALDLPADDPDSGLTAYVEIAAEAAQGHDDLVVAAQSLGAFTALPLCERAPVRRLVLLNAMVPMPGERATDWWGNTGSEEARRAAARAGGYSEEIDLETYFLHDVPADVVAAGREQQRNEADVAFDEPCPFTAWPEIPTTVLAGRDDRFFPLAFQQRVAHDRLGLDAQALPGGHLNALSEPDAVTAALLAG